MSTSGPTATFAYLAGTSNCGSTLMSFILRAQPGVSSVGEVAWAMPKERPGLYKCSCGDTLETCPFWLEVNSLMDKKGYLFNANNWDMAFRLGRNRLVNRMALGFVGKNRIEGLRDFIVAKIPAWQDRLREVGARNVALADSIAAVSNASVFIDASKEPGRLRLLMKYGRIKPYVIHLLRDSPPFVKSYIRNDPARFSEGIDWWNRTIRQLESLKATMPPDRWLLVRYEDLCADPSREVIRILQFLGVPSDSPILDFRRGSHHIIGNRRMRLGTASEIRLDTSWREALSKKQVNTILRQTAKYRELYRYAQS